MEDNNNVLNGGPWFIREHFLSIRRWEPKFKPTKVSCSLVAVWIRLPKLPFEYYELAILKEIGNAIGPVLRIDSNTASEARGRYARICVQIDLCKPLINQILLDGLVQEIQYEGVHSLCFSCGRVGHRKDGCPHTIKAPTMDGHEVVESLNRENGSTCKGDQVSHKAGIVDEEGKSEFGPWMLVRKTILGPITRQVALVTLLGAQAHLRALFRRQGPMLKPQRLRPIGLCKVWLKEPWVARGVLVRVLRAL